MEFRIVGNITTREESDELKEVVKNALAGIHIRELSNKD